MHVCMYVCPNPTSLAPEASVTVGKHTPSNNTLSNTFCTAYYTLFIDYVLITYRFCLSLP